MWISAEIRWFWRGAPPAAFQEWFLSSVAHPYAAGGGAAREDVYLNEPGQTELGVKSRGGKPGTEIKGLVATLPDAVLDGTFKAPAELWTKWSSSALPLPSMQAILIKKTRWLRKFDTTGPAPREVEVGPDEEPLHGARPAAGCNVELTELEIAGATVWTFGFEAFGELKSVSAHLQAATALLAARNPPAMGDAVPASYPAWLSASSPRPDGTPAAPRRTSGSG